MADVEKYLNLARRAREEGNAEDAKKFYDMVRIEDPENFEARLYYPYYNFLDGTKLEMEANYIKVLSASMSVLKDAIPSDGDGSAVTEEFCELLHQFACDLIRTTARLRQEGIDWEKGIVAALKIGDCLEICRRNDPAWQAKFIEIWDGAEYIAFHPYKWTEGLTVDFAEYDEKARSYDPEHKSPNEDVANQKTMEDLKREAIAEAWENIARMDKERAEREDRERAARKEAAEAQLAKIRAEREAREAEERAAGKATYRKKSKFDIGNIIKPVIIVGVIILFVAIGVISLMCA